MTTIRVGALLVALAGLFPTPGLADPIHANIPARLFGNLDQDDVPNCVFGGVNLGCGPVATVNSFVFLQRQYREVYQRSLVPFKDDAGPSKDEMVAVATILGGERYMRSCCPPGGTSPTRLINGKVSYLEGLPASATEPAVPGVAPGKTIYKAQISGGWNAAQGGPKPAWVEDNVFPTWQFLSDELKKGQDVEIVINFGGNTAHAVTLTDFDWVDLDDDGIIDRHEGTIGVIDPRTGEHATKPIEQGFKDGPIRVEFDLVNLEAGNIRVAVSESPKIPKSQQVGPTTAGESKQTLHFDAGSELLTLTPFELTAAYLTDLVATPLQPQRIDPIFASDPLLGATVVVDQFQFRAQLDDGAYLFWPVGDGRIELTKDSQVLLRATINNLIFDARLPSPFFGQLLDVQIADGSGSSFLAAVGDLMRDPDALPFDFFIAPALNFHRETAGFSQSASSAAAAGIAQNGSVPEPPMTVLLVAMAIVLAWTRRRSGQLPAPRRHLPRPV